MKFKMFVFCLSFLMFLFIIGSQSATVEAKKIIIEEDDNPSEVIIYAHRNSYGITVSDDENRNELLVSIPIMGIE